MKESLGQKVSKASDSTDAGASPRPQKEKAWHWSYICCTQVEVVNIQANNPADCSSRRQLLAEADLNVFTKTTFDGASATEIAAVR